MKIIRWIPLLMIAVLAVACADEPAPTPTLVPPTQTPFIITATPQPATVTPTPSPSPTVTLTPDVETEEPATDDNAGDSNNTQGEPAKPVSNIKPNCTPRQSWQTYAVVVGDTLGRLATQTDSTLNTLATANCLVNPNIIVVGQTLRVPKQPDKGDDEPIIEDLISQFNTSQSAAVPGETITLSWRSDAGTVITIVNKTLSTTIIGSDLGATGALTYTIPNTVDPDVTSAITFSISGKLVRDGDDVFANPVDRTITVETPLDDECDATGATDTTDDDCEEPECDATGATDTTDDDCEEPECDATGATDTTDDDCEEPECDATGATDTTDDDCEEPECDATGATDTTDDDCEEPECDATGATDTTDDDCEEPECDATGATDTTDDDCDTTDDDNSDDDNNNDDDTDETD